jgi:stage II sporulation protein D
MAAKGKTSAAVGLATCVAVLAALAWPAGAAGAKWVIKGRGWGHGVGMSQYGAYGLARHGRTYRKIVGHYYQHTQIGHAGSQTIRVLLDSGPDSVSFRKASRACGKPLRRHHGYRFKRSGSDVILRGSHGARLANCGRTGTATGRGSIRVGGKGVYRGKLKATAADGGLLVINAVGLDAYVKGVVPNEVPSSWPRAALEAQAVAARSYALATSGGGDFDVYDDTRSQVYGGIGSETARTNVAAAGTRGQVVLYNGEVAQTFFSACSGGHTESVQNVFFGPPVPYLVGVPDPYDGACPLHSWTLRFTGAEISAKLGAYLDGGLKQVVVTKRGTSPRIVWARLIGSGGTTMIRGDQLQSALGAYDRWMTFSKVVGGKAAPAPAGGDHSAGGVTR